MQVLVSVIGPNPHRDLDVFPVLDEKKKALKTSINKTGFWDNVMVRAKGNAINGTVFTSQKELDAYLKENYPNGKPVDFPCELCYGHNRLYTLYDINKDPACENIDIIDIPVKYHDDNQMLQIMVHENRQEWQHNISAMIESVRRVYNTLQEQLAEYGPEDFEKYREKYGDHALSDSKAFKEAKGTHGVGFNTIKAFLGGEWEDTDIRAPLLAIKASEEGLFELPDCYSVNSSSGLLNSVRLVSKIHDIKVPPYFRDLWTEKVFKMYDEADQIPTVKSLKGAIGKASAATPMNPITFLEKGISEEIKPVQLIADLLWTKEKFTFDDAVTIDGLISEKEDWSQHIETAVEYVVNKKKRSEARKAGKEPEPETPPTEIPPTAPGDDPNLGSLDAGTITGSAGLTTSAGSSVIQDIRPMVKLFSMNAPLVTDCAEELEGRVSEVDPDDAKFFEELNRGFLTFAMLIIEKFGKKTATDYIDEAAGRLEKLKAAAEETAAEETAAEETAAEETEVEETAAEETAAEETEVEETEVEEAASTTKGKGRKGLLSKTAKKK